MSGICIVAEIGRAQKGFFLHLHVFIYSLLTMISFSRTLLSRHSRECLVMAGPKETHSSKLEILPMGLCSGLIVMTRARGHMRLPVRDQTRYDFLFLLRWTKKFLLLAFLPIFQKSFPLADLLELLDLLLG